MMFHSSPIKKLSVKTDLEKSGSGSADKVGSVLENADQEKISGGDVENLVENHLEYLPIEKLKPDPNQPRQIIDRCHLEDLQRSVEEKGIEIPLVVRHCRDASGSYVIICGHMRFQAAQKAGLKKVPCFVREIAESEAFELAMRDNLCRRSLFVIDEAFGYKRALKSEDICSQQILARELGVSPSRVSQMLGLTRLDQDLVDLIREKQREEFNRSNDGESVFRITERHLRELVGMERVEDQKEVIEHIFEVHASVSEVIPKNTSKLYL